MRSQILYFGAPGRIRTYMSLELGLQPSGPPIAQPAHILTLSKRPYVRVTTKPILLVTLFPYSMPMEGGALCSYGGYLCHSSSDVYTLTHAS